MKALTQQRCEPVSVKSADSTALDIHYILRTHLAAWRVPELARLLSLDCRTLYQAVASGQLPAMRIGTAIRINPADALAWIQSRTTAIDAKIQLACDKQRGYRTQ